MILGREVFPSLESAINEGWPKEGYDEHNDNHHYLEDFPWIHGPPFVVDGSLNIHFISCLDSVNVCIHNLYMSTLFHLQSFANQVYDS